MRWWLSALSRVQSVFAVDHAWVVGIDQLWIAAVMALLNAANWDQSRSPSSAPAATPETHQQTTVRWAIEPRANGSRLFRLGRRIVSGESRVGAGRCGWTADVFEPMRLEDCVIV